MTVRRGSGRPRKLAPAVVVGLVALCAVGCSEDDGGEAVAEPVRRASGDIADFCVEAFTGSLGPGADRGQQVVGEGSTDGPVRTDFQPEPGIGVHGDALCVRGHYELYTPGWEVGEIEYRVELVSPDPGEPLLPHTYVLRQEQEDVHELIAPDTPCADVTWTYRLEGPQGATETWEVASRHGIDCPD